MVRPDQAVDVVLLFAIGRQGSPVLGIDLANNDVENWHQSRKSILYLTISISNCIFKQLSSDNTFPRSQMIYAFPKLAIQMHIKIGQLINCLIQFFYI